MSPGIRMNRFLASAGLGSRRKCEELIAGGRVRMNGETVTGFATMVDPGEDLVTVDGRTVEMPEKRIVLVLNKPAGILSAASDDRGRKTVLDIARESGFRSRVYPVGRLDMDTSGILLLTDDGEFSFRLTHPSYKVEKEYLVTVEGSVCEKTVERLRSGVKLEDFTTSPCEVEILSVERDRSRLIVRLREGKKRQIRRMFLATGHRVKALHRRSVGGISFDDLEPGEMRPLSDAEEKELRRQAGLL